MLRLAASRRVLSYNKSTFNSARSYAQEALAQPTKTKSKGGVRSALTSSAILLGTAAFLYYSHDSTAGIHRWVALPITHYLTKDDPEKAHQLAVKALASGFAPVDKGTDDPRLATTVFGKHFSNPIGIAAGFDKHAEAIDGLFNLGFGYVEVGSVTPEPQPGNPKPRLFRVPESSSVVNRYGFNSEGHLAVLSRLRHRVTNFVSYYASTFPSSFFPLPPADATPFYSPTTALLASPSGAEAQIPDKLDLPRSLREGHVLGINLGKNKTSDPDSIADFVNGVHSLGPYADVLIINVSSPNTPGLRDLQRRGMVQELLSGVIEARSSLPGKVRPPVLVKIAPDLNDDEVEDIAAAVLASGADGIIVSNTTISRPSPSSVGGQSPTLRETGGLSGPPVKPLALKVLGKLYEATEGKVTLVGCGGIGSGQDAIEYARAGASLVQMYTSFVYEGFGLARKVKDELSRILESEGKTWADVVGENPKEARRVRLELEEQERAARAAEAHRVQAEGSFEKGLKEVEGELESLFAQLAQLEAPLPVAAQPPVPAISTQGGEKEVPLPPPVVPGEPVKVEPIESVVPEQRVGLVDPVAVPAQAVLDEKAIAVLLDPAAAQVQAGLDVSKPTVKEVVDAKAVDPVRSPEAKRWV
ncbi:hypothetical protein T439DRAFT_325900 [Meredithblackwellia eburnea MCA 4105]